MKMESNSEESGNSSLITNIPTSDDDCNENSLVTITLVNQQASSECDTLKGQIATPPHFDLSRSDLIRLLSYLEGELQARDIVIATLKAEKAKQMLYQAKYGRLGLNDPFSALQRDSETCAASDDFDEASVGRLYESQLAHLERLIAVQRRAHQRAKQVLSAAERRHARSVRELDQEKKRRAHDAAQGDDVCMMLEKERERLKQELENQKSEEAKVEKEFEKARKALVDEKERHKQIVTYLLQERRQLLVRLMEERQRNMRTLQQQGADKPSQEESPSTANTNNRQEAELIKELDVLKKQLEDERKETSTLKEIVKAQEEDLNLIRQMILAKSRQASSQQHQSPTTPNNPKLPSMAKSSKGGESPVSSSSSVPDGKHQATRPSPTALPPGYQVTMQRPVQHQQHYVPTDPNSPMINTTAPIRLLTNPAYQQHPSHQSNVTPVASKAGPLPRSRAVPPPAPHSSSYTSSRGNSAVSERLDHASGGPGTSGYAAPRVIPIQLIGPSNAGAMPSHQQPVANTTTSSSRRSGPAAAGSPSSNQGMVSAARNYMSNVVSAVTNAATGSNLISGSASGSRRGHSTVMAPSSTGGSSPQREHWSYGTQATALASPPLPAGDSGGQRPSHSSVNTHRAGIAASVHNVSQQQQYQQQQQQQASGSVARKGNVPSRSAVSAASGQQQVSAAGNKTTVSAGLETRKREDLVEPEIVQLQDVINSMASNMPLSQIDHCVVSAVTSGAAYDPIASSDPHGLTNVTSVRRPLMSPQRVHQNINPTTLAMTNNGNIRVITQMASYYRTQPMSPTTNIVIHRSLALPMADTQTPTKRTPTPVPLNRNPLPSSTNGVPAPPVTKTSALNCSPTVSLTDCSPPGITDIPQGQPSPSASSPSSHGTIGRKVKAVSGLANKLQKRVVAGVVGHSTSRQSKSDVSSDERDQNIRSTQV